MRDFLDEFLFSHLSKRKFTSPLEQTVMSLVLRSRYFLKLSLAVAYRTLPLMGAVSGDQLTKIILEMAILS